MTPQEQEILIACDWLEEHPVELHPVLFSIVNENINPDILKKRLPYWLENGNEKYCAVRFDYNHCKAICDFLGWRMGSVGMHSSLFRKGYFERISEIIKFNRYNPS